MAKRRFRIEGGNKIQINSKNNNYHDAIRSYLLGSVMGGILIQRNMLLLHANALEKSGKVPLGPHQKNKLYLNLYTK